MPLSGVEHRLCHIISQNIMVFRSEWIGVYGHFKIIKGIK
jgi:hypothetical protein